jgi:hypothetical protein
MSDNREVLKLGSSEGTGVLGPGDTGAQIAIPSLNGMRRVPSLGVYRPRTSRTTAMRGGTAAIKLNHRVPPWR